MLEAGGGRAKGRGNACISSEKASFDDRVGFKLEPSKQILGDC